jgi:hypothetical protein
MLLDFEIAIRVGGWSSGAMTGAGISGTKETSVTGGVVLATERFTRKYQ